MKSKTFKLATLIALKTLNIAASLAAATLVLFSCSVEEMNSPTGKSASKGEVREVIVTASMEDGAALDTRTSLVTDASNAPSAIYWTPQDKIKIFSDGQAAEFTSINEEPAPVARFRGYVSFVTGADDGQEIAYVWGLYPYREDAVYSEPDPGVSRTATITTTLPAAQTGKANSFDDGMALTIGRSESLSIPFKTVYALMRFSLTRNDIKSVTFKGKNNEPIAGRVTIGMDDTATSPVPIIRSIDTPETEITMTMADGSAFEAGKFYYIVLLPTTFDSGFTFSLTRADGMVGEFKYSPSAPVTLSRNKFSGVTYLDSKVTTWESNQPNNEIWYTVIDGVSDSDAMNIIDWRTLAQDGEQIHPFFDSEKGVWIIQRESAFSDIPDHCFDAQAYSSVSSMNPEYLKSISLPSSVAEIGERAFYRCSNLEEVNFGSDWYEGIYDDAFTSCNIKHLYLPGGNDLGARAFSYNRNLESVTILDDYLDLTYCDNNPFLGCDKLKVFRGGSNVVTSDGKCLVYDDRLVSFAAASTATTETFTVPENIKSIGDNAFNNACAKSIILPEGLETIGWAAFYGSTIQTINIPASVTYINGRAFEDCQDLMTITMEGITPPEIGADVTPFGNAGTALPTDFLIKVPGAGVGRYTNDSPTENPGWNLFRGHYVAYQTDSELWIHEIDNSTNSLYLVGDYTGDGNYDALSEGGFFLSSVKRIEPLNILPASVSGNLTTVKIYSLTSGENITKMADYGFSNEHPATSGLNQASTIDWVSLPNTVTEIGQKAFKGCSNLLLNPLAGWRGNNLTTIGDEAFNGCSSMIWEDQTYFPGSYNQYGSISSISAMAFKNCTSLNWALGFTSGPSIGQDAFEGSSLPAVYFYRVSPSIEKGAFKNCTQLKRSYLLGVTEVKDSTFAGCTNLETVAFAVVDGHEQYIKSFGKYAFYRCSSLSGLGSIDSDGVSEVYSLETITNTSLTYTGLTKLRLPSLARLTESSVFMNIPLVSLELPNLTYAAGNSFMYLSPDVEELYLPSITSFGAADLFSPGRPSKLILGPNIANINSRLWGYFTFSSVHPYEVELYLEGTTPPTVTENLFDSKGNGEQMLSIRGIYVPSGSVEAYRTNSSWIAALNKIGASVDVIQAMPAE